MRMISCIGAMVLASVASMSAMAADKPTTQPANQSAMALMQQCMDQLKECKSVIGQAYTAQSSGQTDQAKDLLAKAKTSIDQCMSSMTALKTNYAPQMEGAMKAIKSS